VVLLVLQLSLLRLVSFRKKERKKEKEYVECAFVGKEGEREEGEGSSPIIICIVFQWICLRVDCR